MSYTIILASAEKRDAMQETKISQDVVSPSEYIFMRRVALFLLLLLVFIIGIGVAKLLEYYLLATKTSELGNGGYEIVGSPTSYDVTAVELSHESRYRGHLGHQTFSCCNNLLLFLVSSVRAMSLWLSSCCGVENKRRWTSKESSHTV